MFLSLCLFAVVIVLVIVSVFGEVGSCSYHCKIAW